MAATTPGDAAVFLQYIYKLGVQQQLCTAFSKHLCTYQFKALMVKGANMGVADFIKAGKRFFRLYIGRINGAARVFIRATTSSKIPRMTIFLFCAS